MMSLAIALSVDYNLFLILRWREGIAAGDSPLDATATSLVYAGEWELRPESL